MKARLFGHDVTSLCKNGNPAPFCRRNTREGLLLVGQGSESRSLGCEARFWRVWAVKMMESKREPDRRLTDLDSQFSTSSLELTDEGRELQGKLDRAREKHKLQEKQGAKKLLPEDEFQPANRSTSSFMRL